MTIEPAALAARFLAFGLGYWALARYGVHHSPEVTGAALVWLPAGLAVAAMYRWGWRWRADSSG